MKTSNESVVNCMTRESTTKTLNRNNTNTATGNEPEFRTNYCTIITQKCHTWTKFDYISFCTFLEMSKASHTLLCPFGAADCDTDHYPVVAKGRERLAVNKQRSHRFDMERFNLEKLKEVEGKERYRVEVPNRFAASGDMDAVVDLTVLGKLSGRI
jgi:hypothetical protein